MKSALNIKIILYNSAINRRFLISVANRFVHAFTLEGGSESHRAMTMKEPSLYPPLISTLSEDVLIICPLGLIRQCLFVKKKVHEIGILDFHKC